MLAKQKALLCSAFCLYTARGHGCSVHTSCVHGPCSRVVHVHRPLYETRRAAADWCLHTENVRRCCTAKMPVMTVVVIVSVMAMTLIGFMLVAVFLALRLDSLSRVSRSGVVSVVLGCPLSQIPLRCPASEPASSRAGLPPASELDSVMEFGLSRAIQFASSSLAGLRPARKLVADLVSNLSQTGSSHLDMSRWLEPGRRPVRSWSATC